MSILPMIKVEFKRNIWVAWVAVLLTAFWAGGSTNSELADGAYRSMLNFTDSNIFIQSIYDRMVVCCGWWVLLFVFVQFGRDSLIFKKALPYTDKKLLLSKFTAFLAVLGAGFAAYALICLVMLRKYDYMFYAMKHFGPTFFGMCYLTPAGMLIIGISAALFALAVYWGLTFCCCLCRNSVQGCALGIFYAVTLASVNLFLNESAEADTSLHHNIALWLKSISPNAFVYTYEIMTGVVWLIIILITMPLCFALYGGGESKHPLFRYGFADKLTIAAAVLCCGCSGRSIFGLSESEKGLGFIIGAVTGAAAAAAINTIIKRRAAK
ncbi:MAG: hypothetical protein IJR45_05020 [Firmicutes bacterium]|nr:hypothetical protein [Bacillota bacterium]